MVDLVGIEPTTSRLRRGALSGFGRVHQFLNRAMGFPTLELSLAGQSLRSSPELLPVHEQPWSAASSGRGLAAIVFGQARGRILGATDVESA